MVVAVIVVVLLVIALVVVAYRDGKSDGDAEGFTRGVVEGRRQQARATLEAAQVEKARSVEATAAVHGTADVVRTAPLPAGAAQVLKENSAAIEKLGGAPKPRAPERGNRGNRHR